MCKTININTNKCIYLFMVFKFMRLEETVHDRLKKHGAGNGKTFNYVVNEALDALEEIKTKESKNDG